MLLAYSGLGVVGDVPWYGGSSPSAAGTPGSPSSAPGGGSGVGPGAGTRSSPALERRLSAPRRHTGGRSYLRRPQEEFTTATPWRSNPTARNLFSFPFLGVVEVGQSLTDGLVPRLGAHGCVQSTSRAYFPPSPQLSGLRMRGGALGDHSGAVTSDHVRNAKTLKALGVKL